MSPMVVPRSAQLVAEDSDFSLYAVTTFKKHSAEFVHKCREQKWIPRDFKYVEGGKEEERKEVERVGGDERKLWGETLRLGRTAWSEAVMVWIHVLVLRVFVETVLRYGLPLDFVCGLIRVCSFPNGFCRITILTWLSNSRLRRRSKQTAPRRISRISTRTWLAMHLGATRKAASSGTTLATCTQAARPAPSTRRMCSTNLNSTETSLLRWQKRSFRIYLPVWVH